ncbi:MAG: hypothetical protein KDE15_06095 [Erythrobacter sp.]|nr:hypothetical protein [Erythrobacter sp.]
MTIARTASLALPLLLALAACDAGPSGAEPAADGAAEAPVDYTYTVAPADGTFAPRDDCSGQPGAADFLASLRRAADQHDTEALLALADPDVRLGFGGVDGADNMRAEFDAPDGEMWQELADLMGMGCAIDDFGNMMLPWYFAQDTGGDPFETMLVTGENVPLRQQADAEAPVLKRISWDVVQLAPIDGGDGTTNYGQPDADGWIAVFAGGDSPATGYMRESDLRSVIDYRLVAQRGEQGWRITALLAGD